jgi:hypothetical protein
MQVFSIVSRAIIVGLTISQLPPIQNTLLITMTNLLQIVDFWHIDMADLMQAVNSRHGEIFTPTLKLTWHPIVSSFFFNFIPLYIFVISDVFFNKTL